MTLASYVRGHGRWVLRAGVDDRVEEPGTVPFDILFTTTATRTGYLPLTGETTPPQFYAALGIDGAEAPQVVEGMTVESVRFVLDGGLLTTENNAPFDAAGADPTTNVPHAVTAGTAGPHSLVAEVRFVGNPAVYGVGAEFTVATAGAPVLTLQADDDAGFGSPVPLNGAQLRPTDFARLTADHLLGQVSVYLDDEATPLTLGAAPWHLFGTDTSGQPRPNNLPVGEHTVRVVATSVNGDAQTVARFTVATAPATAPTVPALSGMSDDTAAILSWQPSDRAVTYELRRGTTTIYTGSALSFYDTGRTNGTAYDYQVRAVNAVGASAWSDTVTVTPQDTGQAGGPASDDHSVVVAWFKANTGPRYPFTQTTGSTTISTPGAVIERRKFTGRVVIAADDVTLRDCEVRASGNEAVFVNQGVKGTLIERCDLRVHSTGGIAACVRGNGAGTDAPKHGGNITVRFSKLEGYGDALKAESCSLYEWNYAIATREPVSETHMDGFQGSGKSYTTVRNNFIHITMSREANANVFFQATNNSADNDAPRFDVFVYENWLSGPAKYHLQAENGKPGGPGDTGYLRGFGAWDNRFYRNPIDLRPTRGPANGEAGVFLDAVPAGKVPLGWFADDASRAPVPRGNIYGGS